MAKINQLSQERAEQESVIFMAEAEAGFHGTPAPKKYVRTINIFGTDYPVVNLGEDVSVEAIKFEQDLISKFTD